VDDSKDIVAEGTRRTVGRATLRRLSRLAGDWQREEREKQQLAGRLLVATGIIALAAGALVFWF
jgi:hypothetical protein